MGNPFEDEGVKAALNSGRPPEEIAYIICPLCGHASYYNEGSHWECSECDHSVRGDALDQLIDEGEVAYLSDFEPYDPEPGP